MPNTLINVSNRLPVTVEEDRVIRSSGGLVAALEGLPEGQYETKWIGWPGCCFSRRKPATGNRAEVGRRARLRRGVSQPRRSYHILRGFFQFQHLAIAALPAQLSALRTCLVAHYQNVNRTFAEKVLETVN